ncbi:UBA domain-containing protein 3 [Smittium mucronatum]|uniref:UBA domain-containing protein 3 n=1 Tax=Smittium mucronatum TaxID=133383 RepID=A0A1R0GLR6_9FUNG|nr:UBA domain-containing protein 3 [Smittium mucronatum]
MATTLNEREKKLLNEKNAKILQQMLRQEGNSVCADCGTQGPRWASWNLGVFLCIRCGGFHRRIGTHISKVKSISLDNWLPEQIEHFSKIGNIKANEYFYPNPETRVSTRSDSQLERFIRDKYERRMFVNRRNNIPDPSIVSEGPVKAEYSSTSNISMSSNERNKISGLTKLKDLGFTDVRENLAALERFDYRVESAIRYLNSKSSKNMYNASHHKVKQLVNMGFENIEQNIKALQKFNGNVTSSIDYLINSPSAKDNTAGSSDMPPLPPKGTAKKNATAVDLLGLDMDSNLSISSPKNNTVDPFGDFIGASEAKINDTIPSNPSTTISSTPAQEQPKSETVSSPSVFDKDFILSLYSGGSSNSSVPATNQSQSQAFNNIAPQNSLLNSLGNNGPNQSNVYSTGSGLNSSHDSTPSFQAQLPNYSQQQNSFTSQTTSSVQNVHVGYNAGTGHNDIFDFSNMPAATSNNHSSTQNTASQPKPLVADLLDSQNPWAQPTQSTTKNNLVDLDSFFK